MRGADTHDDVASQGIFYHKMQYLRLFKYTKFLADTVIAVREAGADSSVQSDTLTEVTAYLKETKRALNALIDAQAKAVSMSAGKEQAFEYRNSVTVAMENLRKPVDKLEMIVDKEMWPMPSYGDLIFEV